MYLTIPVQDMSYLTMRMRTFNHHKMQQDVTLISHRVNLFQLHHFCMHLLFPAMHPSDSLLFYGNQAAIPLPCCNPFLILTYYCHLAQLLITVNVQEEESGDTRPGPYPLKCRKNFFPYCNMQNITNNNQYEPCTIFFHIIYQIDHVD